ncbi:unnamed protein product [Chondrus crispus]|uniref:3-hydroxyanthranilate 3,4-dioxygenase n=1 Tax=Chondrus crispus TaxID=2769 RepID=R7QEK0_CHOCR|nr:unnamed protein product [Chondrus crispus]CDF36937.1 unnamed protein product [Chondrus crispus]|eukprot:XP_005716756.1 unnamed protein product [Chondrus crispus]
MGRLQAFNIQKWLSANRHLLVPPVGNKLLFEGEFKVMLVAGPNARTDYHIEAGEEWFYQLEGDMVLKVVDDGALYDVPISAGETFCLPARDSLKGDDARQPRHRRRARTPPGGARLPQMVLPAGRMRPSVV